MHRLQVPRARPSATALAKESESMQAAWAAYNDALATLAETLYEVCALALGLEEGWFRRRIRSTATSSAPSTTRSRSRPTLCHSPGRCVADTR